MDKLLRQNWKSLLPLPILTGAVTAIVLLLETLGGLQLLELQVFDRGLRSRPTAPPDDRLLVVGIQETDLEKYGVPLPDGILAEVLQRLQAGRARVIGLDLYRNLPEPPGTPDLYAQFQAKNVVGIVQLGQQTGQWIGPPPILLADQIGFNDLLLDSDAVVRRGLLFATDGEQSYQALAFRLARSYLQDQGIRPQLLESPKDGLAWGAATLTPLQPHTGGYARLDDRGYQLLLDYRSLEGVAPVVSVQDLLTDQVSPSLIADRIVLIGSVAPSLKDIFLTPYSSGNPDKGDIAGVLVHAHLTKQLLDLALGQYAPFRFLSPGLEIFWVGFWSLLGGLILWQRQSPWLSVGGTGGALLILWGLQFGLLRWQIWIPVVSPTLGLGFGLVLWLGYSRYRLWELQQSLLTQVRAQNEAIAELKALSQPTTKQQYPITRLPEGDTTEIPLSPHLDNTLVPSAGSPGSPSRPVALPLGGTLGLGGRYLIQKVLGEGGFGITYLAKDMQRPGQPICVIKRLSPARRDPRFLQAAQRLFHSEAQILENLGRLHDRIPQLLAYFEENQEFYLVQDFIEGNPFSDELVPGVPLAPPAVVDILLDVLPTLDFIHRHQLIHRDIKPSNLIRRKDGAFVVIDFGAVKQFSEMSEGRTLSLGTPGYMAPEQAAGYPRFNSDLYALGMVAIQCLLGTPPSELDINPETGDLIWEPLVQSQYLTQPRIIYFIALLRKLVEYNAIDRYSSAEEALKVFKKFKKSLSSPTLT